MVKVAALQPLDTDMKASEKHGSTISTPPTPSPRQPIPGPMSLPLIGNLHEIDFDSPLTTFMKFSKIYGGLYSLDFGRGARRAFIDRILISFF